MFILHLCFDGNFVSNSCSVFERYYPNKNLFLITQKLEKCKMVKDKDYFMPISLSCENFEEIQNLCLKNNVDTILLHGLVGTYVELLKYLTVKYKYKVYWIFWGFELYTSLAQMGRYSLIDEKFSFFSLHSYIYPNKYNMLLRKMLGKQIYCEILQEAIPFIDYFCFWNYEDYKLLQDEFHTNMKFKFFAYDAAEISDIDSSILPPLPSKKRNTILINHQASVTGNHHTIMKHIALIDNKNSFEKIIPLAYGLSSIRRLVLKEGKKLFSDKFHPILNYMPKDEYLSFINQVEVAIIGARRQEASGNIISLLRAGVKVFLREDNNLLKYYRDKGYIVFSYENDLRTVDDISPLSIEEQLHNRDCSIKNKLYYEQFMPNLFID